MLNVTNIDTTDVSSDEDGDGAPAEAKFDRLVSRHRNFTREFDKNMEMCCSRLSALMNRSSNSIVIRICNSLFNIDFAVSSLKNMESKYEDCSLCPNVKHAPVADANNLGNITLDLNEVKSMDTLASPLNYIKSQVLILSPTVISPTVTTKRFNNNQDDGEGDETYVEDDSEDSSQDYFVFFVDKNSGATSTYKSIVAALKWIYKKTTTIPPALKTCIVSLIITIFQWVIYIFSITYYRAQDSASVDHSKFFGVFSGALLHDQLSLYRIVTSALFHNSLGHLIISTMMHFKFSSVFEYVYGMILTLLMYFICSAYGMVGVCWYIPNVLQANGMAGDWGMAGALLSRLFVFPYLFTREYQHITNLFMSYICLFFLKTIGHGSEIVVSTHLLSAVSGFCIGVLINTRLRDNNRRVLNNITIDFLCSFILLAVPISSIFLLFISNNSYTR